MQGIKLYRDVREKKSALLNRIVELRRGGRPLLIGTGSVEESELVSAWLQQVQIEHRVLNARQDQQEAEIIAAAGEKNAITVATNMAGRGTDIALGDGVEDMGGLHVISLSLHASYRIERQLFGRSARQGDPGSVESILTLDDPALDKRPGCTMLRLLSGFCSKGKPLNGWTCRPFLRRAQRGHERQQTKIRKVLMKQDKHLRRVLAFSGQFE